MAYQARSLTAACRIVMACSIISVLGLAWIAMAMDTESANINILNEQERTWLKIHSTIIVTTNPDNSPIEYFDTEGRYSGIAADFLTLIQNKLMVQFTLSQPTALTDTNGSARIMRGDLCVAMPAFPQNHEHSLFTRPFVELPSAIIMRRNIENPLDPEGLRGKRICVVSGSADCDYLTRRYPGLSLEAVPSLETALSRVSAGLSDALVANSATASHYMERRGITNLQMVGTTGHVYRPAFAVRDDLPELAAILQKGLNLVRDEERARILKKWVRSDDETQFFGSVRAGVPTFLALVCLAAVGLLVWNRSLNSLVNARTRELNRELAEREQMEDALRESEERYRSIFENSTDGILLTCPNQRILAANPAACRMLGRSEEELIRLDPGGLTCITDSRMTHLLDVRVVTDRLTTELIIRQSDGTELPSEISSCIFSDKEGRPRATFIIRDISERKKAERELRSARQRFQDIIEFLPDATFVVDGEKRVIAWNRAIEEMTGTRKQDVLGKGDYSYSIPFYGERRPMLIDMVADGDLGIAQLYDYVDKKGEIIFGETFVPMPGEGKGAYLWGTASSLLGKDGQIIGAIQSIRDITARKCAEKELRLSEERFRAIFESAQESIFLKDRSLRYSLVNPAMERLFGSPASRLIGMTDEDIFGEEMGRTLRESDLRVLAGEIIREEHTKDVNGCPMVFQTVKVPIRDHKGAIAAVCGIARDITHRKQTEEAFRESERRLRFLSTKLLKAQEEERKRIARELHDSIGQYLIAIKFNLESAIGAASTMEDSTVRNKLAILIPLIQDAVEEIRRICNGLRPSILDDMGIVMTIRWLCREFRGTYPAIRLTEELSATENDIPEPLKIVIFRIVQEALNNAAKYSRAEDVALSLSKTGNRIELIVKDTGRGFNVGEALSRNAYERGLGITGMKERTEYSGGAFSLQSAPGKGTIVCASWHL